jgi:signal transduction histidine kinase
MSAFASLTNRIFFATALLAVLSMGVAIYIVNRAVTRQGEQELQRSIDEAAAQVDAYSKFSRDTFGLEARLIADLPVLKAAVDLQDPATLEPIARGYQNQLANEDLFAIADNRGHVLVRLGTSDVPDDALAAAATIGRTEAIERDAVWPEPHGILLIKSVPIWIDKRQPDVLGTLILGKSLDGAQANLFKRQTNSEIAFGVNGEIKAATLAESTWPALAELLRKPGVRSSIVLNGEEYLAYANPLGPAGPGGQAIGIVLRSRAERQRFLTQLHTLLALTTIVAVLVAILLSYWVARTVTRPVEAITSTMREMAASGDLTRRIPVSPDARWQDEDARLLATTFNSMTDSIEKFQREASVRERLSSLGRLSTVVAHEIRNPLMIIKTSLRTLRRDDTPPEHAKTAVKDIDEEITRLNRIVSEVLDYARPIKFELAPVNLNALAADAVRAASAAGGHPRIRLDLDSAIPEVTTDGDRVRQALLNILDNALQAVAGREPNVRLRTLRIDARRMAIVVTDNGGGIAPEDLPRLFDPYFTTRRTGTGIGLAISRNIIEGLGGRITVASERDRGTEVRIELPLDAPIA